MVFNASNITSANLNVSQLADFSINTSNLTQENFISFMTSNANVSSDGWFLFVIGVVTFIYLWITFTRDTFVFRLDFIQAGLISSLIVTFIMFIGVINPLNLANNFQYVLWFGFIWIIFLILNYLSKEALK